MEITDNELEKPLDVVRDEIAHISEYMDEERERTNGRNGWLDCFRTRVNSVGLSLTLAKRAGDVSAEDYGLYKERLDKVTTKTVEYFKEFGSGDLPEDKRQELLTEFNIFAEPEDDLKD